MSLIAENTIFILYFSQILPKFHNGGRKSYKYFDQGKKSNYFSLIREKCRKYIKKLLLEKDSIQDELMFLKRVILWYGMLCYPMLGMVWGVWYSIVCLCYAMRFICYAMVHVVKDKHSTSVC